MSSLWQPESKVPCIRKHVSGNIRARPPQPRLTVRWGKFTEMLPPQLIVDSESSCTVGPFTIPGDCQRACEGIQSTKAKHKITSTDSSSGATYSTESLMWPPSMDLLSLVTVILPRCALAPRTPTDRLKSFGIGT